MIWLLKCAYSKNVPCPEQFLVATLQNPLNCFLSQSWLADKFWNFLSPSKKIRAALQLNIIWKWKDSGNLNLIHSFVIAKVFFVKYPFW